MRAMMMAKVKIATAVVLVTGLVTGLVTAACAGAATPPPLVSAGGGRVYVVDQNHPQASDSGPGSAAGPFKTIMAAAGKVRPGDTVCVMAGTYRERIELQTGASGAEGRKVTFRSLPRHGATVTGFDAQKASYVRIEGFRFVEKGAVVGDYNEVVGNYFHEVKSAAVSPRRSPRPKGVYVALNRAFRPQAGFTVCGTNWLVERNEVERLHMWGRGDCDYSRYFGDGHVLRWNFFHGTTQEEIGKAHVDGSQTWHLKGREQEFARNVTFEGNVIYNFHQAIIGRSLEGTSWIQNLTARNNIFAHGLSPGGAAWGFCLQAVKDVTVENNLIADIKWFGYGNSSGGTGMLKNNIWHGTNYYDRRSPGTQASHNIVCKSRKPSSTPTDINKDPLFVDYANNNFRLKPGSPAIDAGEGGRDIGPLAYPHVYYVDADHPGASDEGFGYAGRPFKTLSHAVSVARSGETVVLRTGVYRELVKPEHSGITIRADKDAKPVVSGADLVAGWEREGGSWSAPLAEKPKRVLLNGKKWTGYTYDAAAEKIKVRGLDPRLCVIERVVREHGIDLSGARGVKIEGIDVVHTLGDELVGANGRSPSRRTPKQATRGRGDAAVRARAVPKPAPAEEKPPHDAALAKLYREAETAFIDGDIEGAKALFGKVVRDHPESAYAGKAKEYLEIIE